MAEDTIVIERQDGKIPGLLEVNDYLTKRIGATVAAVIDTEDGVAGAIQKWIGTELRHSHIEGDEIIVGEPVDLAAPVEAPAGDGAPDAPVTAYCHEIAADSAVEITEWERDLEEIVLHDVNGVNVRLRMTPETSCALHDATAYDPAAGADQVRDVDGKRRVTIAEFTRAVDKTLPYRQLAPPALRAFLDELGITIG